MSTSKQKGCVNTEVSPPILLDVSVTGQEFVFAAAVDKKEGEASSSGLSESECRSHVSVVQNEQ